MSVEPSIFPPIIVPPDQVVSDKLLDAIRECDGPIYLQGGASAESFWVALERDYALRIGKSVFAFDPATNTLTPDMSSHLDLRAYISAAVNDSETVRPIIQAMRQPYLDTWFLLGYWRWGDPIGWDSPQHQVESALTAGGFVVVMWPKDCATRRLLKTT